FQAEDGIRDDLVTGVQTCALPIFYRAGCVVLLVLLGMVLSGIPAFAQVDFSGEWSPRFYEDEPERVPGPELGDYLGLPINDAARSEERRVGKAERAHRTAKEWASR